MKTSCFPCDWKSDLFEFAEKNSSATAYRYQEKSIEIFGKVDLLYEIKSLKSRLKILEQQQEFDKQALKLVRTMPDYEAENEIELFIQEKKVKGEKSLNMLDLMRELKLPPPQIEKIMKKLEKRGVTPIHD